jgi:hypothetical protein
MVLSVFNILIGSAALLCGGGCGAMTAWSLSLIRSVPVRPGEPNPNELFDIFFRHMPYCEEVAIGALLCTCILGVLLIIAGAGTMFLKQWSRILTILVGLALIVQFTSLVGYYCAVVIPGQSKALKEFEAYVEKMQKEEEKKRQATGGGKATAPPPPPMFAGTNQGNNVVCLLACVLYGAGLIVVMFLPGTRKAFTEPATQPLESKDDRVDRRRRLLDDDFEAGPSSRRNDLE